MFTPADLAAELGVSASIVRRWLRDHVDRGGGSGPGRSTTSSPLESAPT